MDKANKCTNCGGGLHYSPATNSLICEYCATTFEVDSIATTNEKVPYSSNVSLKETTVSQYHCNSCGSNLNMYKNEVIKRCPNCGSMDLAITNNITYIPDAIVPFEITKEKATQNFYEWIKKRKFAPNNLKKLAKLGKLSGFYTPIWNFDCVTDTTYSGVGIDEHTSGDRKYTTSTNFSGRISNKYKNILISANKQISNITLSKLGDYGLDKLKVYNIEYLCGFIGSDTDFDIHQCYREFNNFVRDAEYRAAKRERSGEFDRISSFKASTQIYEPKFNYIYLPVWANYYTYKDKKYSCYINGFTGKVTGTSPKSAGKIFATVIGVLLAVVIAAVGIYHFVKEDSSLNPPPSNEITYSEEGIDTDLDFDFPEFQSYSL